MLNKREPSERMKNLSTSPIYKIEAKGKDRIQQEFFAKFVLCSNNVDKPLIIDPGETRYWVREVPKLETDDVGFLSKVIKEIPHLMYDLLNHRQLSVKKSSRMYFDPHDLMTPALLRIMMNSRSQMEAALYDLCDDIFRSLGVDSISFISGDLRQMLTDKGIKHLKPRATPSSYTQYYYGMEIEGNYGSRLGKGRFYTLTKIQLYNLYENCRFVDSDEGNADLQQVESSTEDSDLSF